MPITKDEIRDIASLFFTESAEERVNQCGRLTSIMEMELEDHQDVSVTPERQTGVITNGSDRVGHMFVTLPASEVEDCESGPVIIDVTVQQFNKDNYENGLVEVEIESIGEIPEDVGIFTPADALYDCYEF